MSDTLTEFAPAKVNLALHVTARRPDGYHDIDTLCVFADLGDRLTVDASCDDRLELTGRYAPALAAELDNIVLKARDLLREANNGLPATPVAISLEKNLPVASGIGGGSADAAATLRALSRLWGAALPDNASLAMKLGADIPMCLASRPLRASGIGERVELFERFADLAIMLVNPGIEISTPAIFAHLESRSNPPLPALGKSSCFADLVEWMHATRNDLQAPAIQLFPAVAGVLDAVTGSGAAFSRMSGSGATCFGLFPTLGEARIAADGIARRHPEWFVAACGLHHHNERRDHAAV